MSIRAAALLLAVACVATPLAAQQPQTSTPAPATQMREAPRNAVQPGPRRQPDYQRYEPRLANDSTTATTAAAAADRTTITISTLALILIVVILVLLLTN